MKNILLLSSLLFFGFHIWGQQTQIVDFKSIDTYIQLDTIQKSVIGKQNLKFKILKDTKEVYLNARNFENIELIDSNSKIKLELASSKIIFKGNFKNNQDYQVSFTYQTTPKKALYFWGWNEKNTDTNHPNHKQIWTQGQGKYTSNWLPSIDDMNDKIKFNLHIEFDSKYQVAANGKLISKETQGNHSIWHYQMEKPMSSYLVALAIGDYSITNEKSKNGTVLANYIYSSRKEHYDTTYFSNEEIFDFIEESIGVPYPWQGAYKQVPVRDFIYAGMENTCCTLFSDQFIVDKNEFEDFNYCNVNAHELTHQWFGNLITETDSNHHWLHEGFATFYALKAEKKLFGSDYYWFKLYENAELLEAQNAQGSSMPLISLKGNSLNYYQRGAWAIVALENLIGEVYLKKCVQKFLTDYAYQNVTTNDFLKVVIEVTGKDINEYTSKWLYGVDFPSAEALEILKQSQFIKDFLSLAGQRTQPFAGKEVVLSKALDFPINSYIGSEAVEQLINSDLSNPRVIALIKKAFESHDPQVEKTLAISLTSIPETLKTQFEKLLESPSIDTKKEALYNLWNNFECCKFSYLISTNKIKGENQNNFRCLWLVLALNTEGFSIDERQTFFKELNNYTATNHSIKTRESAIHFLQLIDSYNDQSLINLSKGTTHPDWRFSKFCTNTIKKLISTKRYRNRFVNLKEHLPLKVSNLLNL